MSCYIPFNNVLTVNIDIIDTVCFHYLNLLYDAFALSVVAVFQFYIDFTFILVRQ